MISFPDARDRIVQGVSTLGTEIVSLGELAGRTFAEDLNCPFDVPHFDNSQVDGYAVRSSDGLMTRRLVGVGAAGGPASPSVGVGQAVRIFTGAPLPEGADAVVMQEDVRVNGRNVSLAEAPPPGSFIRKKGEEISKGASFMVAGRIATPPLIGLAASFGQTEFAVYRRPRVSVVATGSELVPVGTPLCQGQVYASNVWAIASALEGLGISDVKTFLVDDDPGRTRTVLDAALDCCDVLITLGGVSVGDHDLVRATVAGLGVEEVFWRVAMKPGKPFFFGKRGEKPVFGLPGNPVSALVTFQVLVRPGLRRLMGIQEAEEETMVRLGAPISRQDSRYEFVRAVGRGRVATPVEHQGSHMQTGLAFADTLLHLPEGATDFAAGDLVRSTPLCWTTR